MNRFLRTLQNRIIIAFLITTIVVQPSCKKFVEIPPPTNSLTENAVYSTDATAIATLTGIYSRMSVSSAFTGNSSISLFTGLSADELTLYGGVASSTYLSYYKNQLSAAVAPRAGHEHWEQIYPFIYSCNGAIEKLSVSKTLTPQIKQQLLGEARFLRAFFFFYLINLYGDVPLALTIDPKINTLLARTPQSQVYEQIVIDLKQAIELLSSQYLNATLVSTTTERVRPTQWAAIALLARVYLYTKDYAKAEEEASKLISNSTLYNLATLNTVFLKNSREAIWQIQPTTVDFNTEEAKTFIIPATGPTNSSENPVYLSDFLLNSFKTGDVRAQYGNWIDTTIYPVSSTTFDTVSYPYKYKINSSPGVTSTGGLQEYLMILRLAEQYLIRAEARAQQDNIAGSREDLLEIRRRAGLNDSTLIANDKASLLTAVLNERQVELFSEWGHRWFDLKRTNNINSVMSIVTPIKANGLIWQSFQQLYPLPLSDLNTAPNLVQNPGY